MFDFSYFQASFRYEPLVHSCIYTYKSHFFAAVWAAFVSKFPYCVCPTKSTDDFSPKAPIRADRYQRRCIKRSLSPSIIGHSTASRPYSGWNILFHCSYLSKPFKLQSTHYTFLYRLLPVSDIKYWSWHISNFISTSVLRCLNVCLAIFERVCLSIL